jgi:hypothetical protein
MNGEVNYGAIPLDTPPLVEAKRKSLFIGAVGNFILFKKIWFFPALNGGIFDASDQSSNDLPLFARNDGGVLKNQ